MLKRPKTDKSYDIMIKLIPHVVKSKDPFYIFSKFFKKGDNSLTFAVTLDEINLKNYSDEPIYRHSFKDLNNKPLIGFET